MKSIFEGQNNSFNNSFIWGQRVPLSNPRGTCQVQKPCLQAQAKSFLLRKRVTAMLRAVVSESENGVPFPSQLLNPHLNLGDSLPSMGLFPILWKQKDVLPTCFHGRKKCLKEKEFKWRGEVWAEAKPEDRGPGLTHPCPWHQKSMERT